MTGVTALDEDNNPVELAIIETVVVNDNIYILATQDSDSEIINASILKQTKSDDNYVTYSFVDEDEYEQVMVLFEAIIGQNDEYEIE